MNEPNTGTTIDKARDMGQHAADQVRDMGHRVTDQVRDAGRQAWEAGRRPQTQPTEQQREGAVARTIEQQTAKLPSDAFLWAALGAIGASLILQVARQEHKANFVGQWAPTLLILGLYNKMVKLMGSDAR